MIIRGYDYKFAYTVGAHLDIGDNQIAKTEPNANVKQSVANAIIMSKAYEDKCKLENPDHEVKYLTLAEVRAMSLPDLKILNAEVEEAFKRDAKVTVETESNPKK